MPTLYKTCNINISGAKRVPVNFVLKISCPKCDTSIKYNFNAAPIMYPEEKTVKRIILICDGCQAQFQLPVKIMNIRMVLAYDVQLLKELDD